MDTILIVPGLGDSGRNHWQTWLQGRENTAVRVTQDDWNDPDLARWASRVRDSLDRAPGPVWVVAHSFGCLASVRAVAARPHPVTGALLVAPADPDRVGAGKSLPTAPLPFPSLLVASTTDPWLKLSTATLLANQWGSRLINLGAAGHINADSGYGPWPEGERLLRELQRRMPRMTPSPAVPRHARLTGAGGAWGEDLIDNTVRRDRAGSS